MKFVVFFNPMLYLSFIEQCMTEEVTKATEGSHLTRWLNIDVSLPAVWSRFSSYGISLNGLCSCATKPSGDAGHI